VVVTCRAGVGLELEEEWDETWEVPTTTALLGNYPNPFNPSTTFRYGLSEPGQVSLKVYNMLGQLVRTIVHEHQVEGYYEAVWDGRNEVGATVSSGIYLYRMTAGSFVETRRMMLVK
jgi:flagellar hook assembly protein FlgD